MTRFFRLLVLAVAVLAVGDIVSTAQAQQQQRQRSQQQQRTQPPASTQPQELPPAGTVTVVVDVLAILRDSSAAQSVRGQIERVRNSYQSEISKQENDLRAADQELAKQRAVLSPEAFAQRRRELEKRVTDAQQSVQERRRGLDQSFNQGMERIQKAMIEVIAEIAGEMQYQIVLPKSQVVVVANSLDITPEVMKRLNRKLPQVTVSLPQQR
jgi:Skp family chaperone for outer membrane proteins